MTSRAGASGNFTKISIVVPTYKERDNIPILTKRIFQGTCTVEKSRNLRRSGWEVLLFKRQILRQTDPRPG